MTLSERGARFTRGRIRSHSWCQHIRWWICLKARIIWHGGEVTTIRIALCKEDIVIDLKPIGLIEISPGSDHCNARPAILAWDKDET